MDTANFKDHLFERGLSSSSVKRTFASIRSIVNFAIREHGLNCPNAFSNTFIPEKNDQTRRIPIPSNCLKKIQSDCLRIDDEPRWLIALISDTGMRVSDACVLQACDIHLDDDTPYIDLVEHPWRRLKTPSSERQVPLVGASL